MLQNWEKQILEVEDLGEQRPIFCHEEPISCKTTATLKRLSRFEQRADHNDSQ